ncbi:MAG: OmpH family outer membrane protein [Paludibacteraceae bacterium]|nr:OmpH family outer membrane protein [Paludibacteraceae bacterium]MBP3716414.1 OmpH family outer membrane protein [Paludibacteraceae bacterium]MBR6106208.1 OmpH family outer membrane protein [Paludibacteraceae bacterium]
MKNNLALGILTVAVIILYILHFSSNNSSSAASCQGTADTTSVKDSSATTLNDTVATETMTVNNGIAYVNMDTLLEKYKFAKDINARLLKKEKDARAQLERKDTQLRTDYAKVDERYRKGLMTQTEAKTESERLAKQQQEIQTLSNTLTQNLLDEQKKFNKQLQDTILKFFKEYNEEKHYQAIFSNTSNDNIIYAEKQLNITTEVVNKLNARYKKK